MLSLLSQCRIIACRLIGDNIVAAEAAVLFRNKIICHASRVILRPNLNRIPSCSDASESIVTCSCKSQIGRAVCYALAVTYPSEGARFRSCSYLVPALVVLQRSCAPRIRWSTSFNHYFYHNNYIDHIISDTLFKMGDIMGDFIDYGEIINQIHRNQMNRVFEFNLMLVGLRGTGKSTLVRSLFQGTMKPDESAQSPKLNVYEELLEENGVKLRQRCIETSKYSRHEPAKYSEYIDKQMEAYFVNEQRHSRWHTRDTRVHCCLYLIPPYGEMTLMKEDIECMLALHEKVNLIPIITKTDMFDEQAIELFKQNVLAELENNKIQYYKFHHDDKEDEERFKAVKIEAERFPFAVVAADEPIIENKKAKWIRRNFFSQVDITDTRVDFGALARLLLRHCMLDMMDSTHSRHYAQIKSNILEEARMTKNRNLENMGLEPHEIMRIECNVGYGRALHHDPETDLYDFDAMKADLEHQLEVLKTRRDTLRNRRYNNDSSSAKKSPMVTRMPSERRPLSGSFLAS